MAVSSPDGTTRREIARGIERLGGRQKQLLRIEQLIALGLSQRAVNDPVAAHTLFRIHEGS